MKTLSHWEHGFVTAALQEYSNLKSWIISLGSQSMYVETIRTIRDYHPRLKTLGHRVISIIDALGEPEVPAKSASWLRKHAAEMVQPNHLEKWETSCNSPRLRVSRM
jgi:hypothetical protein